MLRIIFFLIFYTCFQAVSQQQFTLFVNDNQDTPVHHLYLNAWIPAGKTQISSTDEKFLLKLCGNGSSIPVKPVFNEKVRYLAKDGKIYLVKPVKENSNTNFSEEKTLRFSNDEYRVVKFVDFMAEPSGTEIKQSFSDGNRHVKFSILEFQKQHPNYENSYLLFFQKNKHYSLSLDFGVGKGTIALSDLGVKNLYIHTSNTDVDVIYSNRPNLLEMDTMNISVGLADLTIHNAEQARARNILVDAGFGNVILIFRGRTYSKCNVNAELGAGTMKVQLSKEKNPVLIRLKGTFFSSYRLPDNFKEVKPGIFVNEYYAINAPNTLIFDIDISMGSIVFVCK